MAPAFPASGRFVASFKEAVVACIRSRELTVQQACDRYGATPEEIGMWMRRFAMHGRPGLAATKLQTVGRRA